MQAIPGNDARALGAKAAFREKEWIPMATNTRNKATGAALAQKLIAATKKYLAKVPDVPIAGSSFTPDQITNQLQKIVDLHTDANSAKATAKAKVAAEDAGLTSLHTFVNAYKTYVKAAFASTPDVLADFGLSAKARTPLTVEAKAAAAAKRAATRAARHTMGSVQKKTVKGNVTGVVVTPTTSVPTAVAAVPTGAPPPAVPASAVTAPATSAAATPHAA
ncbi:MAG: hypothetical protein ABTD50_01620 [Polyangiaceae bacterium]|jgi:hypothetical protein